MSSDPCPRAGTAPEAVLGPATAMPRPKRPAADQSWRAHHRELKTKWAGAPVAKFDYRAAMIAANRERNRQLAVTRHAEKQAGVDQAVRVFQGQVMPAFRPPSGKLFGVDVEALIVIGPKGAIGTTAAMARLLAPLAAGGRHDEAEIAAVTGCRDVMHLRELLTGIAGKLAAIGLRVDRRKTGIRIGKTQKISARSSAC